MRRDFEFEPVLVLVRRTATVSSAVGATTRVRREGTDHADEAMSIEWRGAVRSGLHGPSVRTGGPASTAARDVVGAATWALHGR